MNVALEILDSLLAPVPSHDIVVSKRAQPSQNQALESHLDAQDFAGLHAVPVSWGSRMKTFCPDILQ